MADPHLNSGERAEIFRHLFLINRSFHFIPLFSVFPSWKMAKNSMPNILRSCAD